MTKIHAIYEKGVFRPVEPVAIDDGTRVELTIAETAPTTPMSSMVSALVDIANLPPEGPIDRFSGADHDRVLYGKSSRR